MLRSFLRSTDWVFRCRTASRTIFTLSTCCRGCTERNGNRIRPVLRLLPEEATTFKTKNTAPQFIEADRNDGGIRIFHDSQHAAFEFLQLPGPTDLSFGENTDELAFQQCIARCIQGVASAPLGPSPARMGIIPNRFDSHLVNAALNIISIGNHADRAGTGEQNQNCRQSTSHDWRPAVLSRVQECSRFHMFARGRLNRLSTHTKKRIVA
jgi:hypothetical protein